MNVPGDYMVASDFTKKAGLVLPKREAAPAEKLRWLLDAIREGSSHPGAIICDIFHRSHASRLMERVGAGCLAFVAADPASQEEVATLPSAARTRHRMRALLFLHVRIPPTDTRLSTGVVGQHDYVSGRIPTDTMPHDLTINRYWCDYDLVDAPLNLRGCDTLRLLTSEGGPSFRISRTILLKPYLDFQTQNF